VIGRSKTPEDKIICSLKNVTKQYVSTSILSEISFDIYNGDCVGIIGIEEAEN
jgi:ABC-type polysaccharide/polyol phosphate transport system ATPase subunit